ncbi:acyl-ACP--UDP-N-acetylglucosamine O-acyltransferase [Botrimarina sp.]|uniref:acyl-ACP--UDP-N-acetylglucosamine O-acyltransferase n=1 Tax=Botrimarina sp. TaxID=2795802 RepID=UPI0032EB2199
MPTKIASNAWIDPRAELDEDVEIGPLCVVGAGAKIGAGTRLISSVTLMGRATLGRDNVIFPHAVIGGEPQDISYTGGETAVEIGDGNVIREGVTINRGTDKEEGVTRIGSNNTLMAGVHVAHDCLLGDHIVIANSTLLGGHVHVEDRASLSGGVAVHHCTTIGRYAFVGGLSRVLHDVAPYLLCEGSPAKPRCINIVALRKNGFNESEIDSLAEAHRLVFRNRADAASARAQMQAAGQLSRSACELFDFLDRQSSGRHGRSRDAVRRAA